MLLSVHVLYILQMMNIVSPESKEAVMNGEIAKDAIPEFYLDDNLLSKSVEAKESNDKVEGANEAVSVENVESSSGASDKSKEKKDKKEKMEKKEKRKEKKEKRKDKSEKKEKRKLEQTSRELKLSEKYRVCLNKKKIRANFQPSFQYLFLAISLWQQHHLLLVVYS